MSKANLTEQVDAVVEARELLDAIDKSARVGYAFKLLKILTDEVEQRTRALKLMVELWDAEHPDDPCGCVGASDDCRYPPTCELCVARLTLAGRINEDR